MAILTDFMERKLLDHIFGVTEMTKLTSLHLGISTTAFSESDTASQALAKEPGTSGTNYNSNGYSRVNVYNNFEDTTAGATNGSQISFLKSLQVTGEVSATGLCLKMHSLPMVRLRPLSMPTMVKSL